MRSDADEPSADGPENAGSRSLAVQTVTHVTTRAARLAEELAKLGVVNAADVAERLAGADAKTLTRLGDLLTAP
jgi:hypothetical protein